MRERLESAASERPEADTEPASQQQQQQQQLLPPAAAESTRQQQRQKAWRKSASPTAANQSNSLPRPPQDAEGHNCIIQLDTAFDSGSQPRTSLVETHQVSAKPAPASGEGPQVRCCPFAETLAHCFKENLHRLARRLSDCLDQLESRHLDPTADKHQLTYSIYQAALTAESFKRAVGLLLFTSCVVFFQLPHSSLNLHLMLAGLLCYLAVIGTCCYTYLLLYRRAAEERLAHNSLAANTHNRKQSLPTDPLRNTHVLNSLHFLVLYLSAAWTVICIFSYPQLGPLMAIIVYIFYTQLAINRRRLVVLVCLVANLFAIVPLSSTTQHQHNDTIASPPPPNSIPMQQAQLQLAPWWRILVSVIAFGAFHAQGLRLNRAIASQCLNSFNDVKRFEEAKSKREAESNKLTKLLERAYPKDLVCEIRDQKLGIRKLDKQFQPFFHRSYEDVTILYADIVKFTSISAMCSPQDLVQLLHELVGRFDKQADKYPCLRIKILGDCYYCVSGVPEATERHARNCVDMALDMIDILDDMAGMAEMVTSFGLKMRVGIHSGRVICGVLGDKKRQFDVYSDDVRLANLMEQSGQPGRVHITERTLKALKGAYEVEPAHKNLKTLFPHLHENMATYFVKPPPGRPKLVLNTPAQIKQRPATGGSGPGRLGPYSSRFRAAANRVKTAQRFIRTIDLPFSNLVDASSSGYDSMSDASSVRGSSGGSLPELQPARRRKRAHRSPEMLTLTIESRCLNDQSCDVDPLTLRFKSAGSDNIYKTSYPLWHLLFLAVSMVCLFTLTLVYKQTIIDPSHIEEALIPFFPYIILHLIASLVHWHQQEFLARRDFRWREIAQRDEEELEKIQNCNTSILYDLLPQHVASHILSQQDARNYEDLYCQSYTCTGVLFASVCNYYQYYDEKLFDKGGLECLRLLNEIICDFDAILDEEQFKPIDKIKTIGATYMAAIGLLPEHRMPEYRIRRPSTVFVASASGTSGGSGGQPRQSPVEDRRQVAAAMRTLAMFVFKMHERLQQLNPQAFFNFSLKAGINLGPVTAGVIAASKPQYDIWGNTVNVASRMESNAEPNKLQITDDVYELLEEFNHENQCKFKFTCREPQDIKGKGLMTTYYLELEAASSGGGGGGSAGVGGG